MSVRALTGMTLPDDLYQPRTTFILDDPLVKLKLLVGHFVVVRPRLRSPGLMTSYSAGAVVVVHGDELIGC